MVSDEELVARLREFLRASDLNTTSTAAVRRKLEHDFGLDLSDKKVFIREQVDLFLALKVSDSGEDEKEHGKPECGGSDGVNEFVSAEEEVQEVRGDEEEKENEGSSGKSRRAKMVSDEELVAGLREFLRTSDLNTTSIATVRRNLEQNFGLDLSDKKAFIREQVEIFLTSEPHGDGEDGTEDERKDDDDDEEEEEEGKPESGGSGWEAEFESAEEEVEEAGDEEGVDDEEEKENDGSSRKRRSKKISKEEGNKRVGGFNKPCSLSPQLQDFLGESVLPRKEVVKRLWAYIREKSLQDPSNKRKIICDERLLPLFNVQDIDTFQINKALSKHIRPLDSGDAGPATTLKSKAKDKQPEKDKEGKRQRRGNALLTPLALSADLIKFIGTGENLLSRPEVIKRVWNYIKQNNLQDPADGRNIRCDDKLKELFKVESFNGFGMAKLLSSHFPKSNQ